MNLQVGQVVYPGQKLGMIRFGSRVDLFFPNDVKVLVQPGDKVTAGESIIGEFPA
jgi:phosphatidylserine decarboxylase